MKFNFYVLFLLLLSIKMQGQLKITEIMYNPPESGDDSLEYLEIVNLTNAPYSLAGHVFSSGIVDTFTQADVIPANGYFVICKNSSAMTNVFAITPHQWKSGSLNNGGEALTISKTDGTIVFTMTFGDSGQGWVDAADGDGPSMELCDLTSDPESKNSWAASPRGTGITINGFEVFGSPGLVNTAVCQPSTADAIIDVTNNSFTPSTVTIQEGQTVQWNFIAGTHNVNGNRSVFPNNPTDFYSGDPAVAPFDYSFTFNTPGTYNYQCDLHAPGMRGIVIVLPINPPVVYKPMSIDEANNVDGNGKIINLDSLVELSGTVYGYNQRTTGTQFTIIDNARNGIGAFNSAKNFGYTVNEGDAVTVRGKLTQFRGLQQIVADTIIFVSANNNLLNPLTVTSLQESTESSLVKIASVTLVDPSQWITGSTFNVDVTDGVNTYQVRVLNTTTLASQSAPTGTFTVTGIGGQFDSSEPFDSGYQLIPRYKEDVSTFAAISSATISNKIKLNPNPTQGTFEIETHLAIQQLEVLNQYGQTIQKLDRNALNVNNLPAGIYYIKLTTPEGIGVKPLVKL